MTNRLQVSTTPRTPFAAVSAMLATASIVAQQSAQYIERAGDYTVHYNVVPAHVLPEVTSQRHSVPAGADGVLNVAVLENGRNVEARIEATAVNLTEQRREVE